MTTSDHASCVAIDEAGVLIRGPSGSGKSRLALALIVAGRTGAIGRTVLVADDRVLLGAEDGHLVAGPPPVLAGLIEIRGVGIRQLPFAAHTRVRLVVDLAAQDGARMPPENALTTEIAGIRVPRLPLPAGHDPLLPLIGLLISRAPPPQT
ncbi:HPr kinase/phosphorylase [Ancylobacter terrae]|uniref:HPr kinase/phosphorylase n=1 Tax=Ancylobacter sp. sgz301288 TaxID=3342077 RepID=UPI00385D3FB1